MQRSPDDGDFCCERKGEEDEQRTDEKNGKYAADGICEKGDF